MFLIILCSVFSSGVFAVTWTPITATDKLLLSVDLSSVSKVEVEGYRQYRKLWVKQVIIKPDSVFSIGDHSYNLYWVDCKNDAYIRKSLSIFGKDGNLEKSIPYPDSLVEYIRPDSIMKDLIVKPCSIKL